MKKPAVIIVLISLIVLAVICVIGNIITVADKVSELSPWLGYLFYGVLLTLTAVFIVWPTLRIVFTPELAPADEPMTEEGTEAAEEVVKKSAQNVFVLTTISQSGALDVFTVLSVNISLINRLVELRGKRPSFGQIIRLYAAVASSSVLIASADEVLDDINLGEILGVSGLNVTGAVFRSAANGMMNAFVTLRIGLTAMKYLEVGSVEFNGNRQLIRKEIRRKAIKRIPAVVGNGIKSGILGIKNLF